MVDIVRRLIGERINNVNKVNYVNRANKVTHNDVSSQEVALQKNEHSLIKGLYPILDISITPLSKLKKVALGIIQGGPHILQFRAKGLSSRELLNQSFSLRDMTKREGIAFIVNDRVDIALISNADGVHIGQRDLTCREARRLLGRDKLLGVSTHNLQEALRAIEDGADYISFGPIFSTSTKEDTDLPKGIERLKDIKDSVEVPVVAIGGIKEENLKEVVETGVDLVAIVSDILTADDITGKIKKLKSIIESESIGDCSR